VWQKLIKQTQCPIKGASAQHDLRGTIIVFFRL
jgi:hypothetical protein